MADTIDYRQAYDVIRETVEGRAYTLLEGLASHLAKKILNRFPVYRVTLRIRKMTPPIPGQIKFIEVELTRFQENTSKLIDNDPQKE